MSDSTSIGRGPASGGNENHDGDPRNKTLGESVTQELPAGNPLQDDGTPDAPDAPDAPEGAVVPVVAGHRAAGAHQATPAGRTHRNR